MKLSVFPAYAFVLVTGSLLAGWVIQNLWAWFALPFGLPALTLAHAVGVDLLVSFLAINPTGLYAHKSLNNAEKGKNGLYMVYARPLFYLACGFVASLFMSGGAS